MKNHWYQELLSEGEQFPDGGALSAELYETLDEMSYHCHVDPILLRKEEMVYDNNDYIRIGKVTSSFLLLESYLKKFIYSYYGGFPVNYLDKLQFNQKLKILEETSAKPLIGILQKIANVRNHYIHAIYNKRQVEQSELDQVLNQYSQVFKVPEIQNLKTQFIDPVDLFIKFVECCSVDLMSLVVENVGNATITQHIVYAMVENNISYEEAMKEICNQKPSMKTNIDNIKLNPYLMSVLKSNAENSVNNGF